MPRRPNFLIFMTDMLQSRVIRPGHPCLTPNLERFQSEGVSFDSAFTPAAHCCPARATFWTGLYPCRHGIFNNIHNGQAINTSLNPGVRTFGELLSDGGYNLAYAGKWHVSNDKGPAERGWEELIVTSNAGDDSPLDWGAWERKAAARMARDSARRPGEIIRPGWDDWTLYGTSSQPVSERIEGRIVSAATEALPRLVSGKSPWCLYIGIPDRRFFVPPEYLRMYDVDRVPLPPNYGDRMEDKPRIYQRQRREIWDHLSQRETREGVAHYWAYFSMIDALFGEVMQALERSGASEDTVVVFLSDHGNYAGAHGLWGLGVPAFDEVYRIPLVVRWPDRLANVGARLDPFVTLADLAPTILELAAIDAGAELTGRSLVPWLSGKEPDDWRDHFYSQFNGVELYYSQRIVQTKRYKYVFNGFDFDELYDLRDDSHELVNLSERADMEPVRLAMFQRLWRSAKETGDTMHRPFPMTAIAPYGPMTAFD